MSDRYFKVVGVTFVPLYPANLQHLADAHNAPDRGEPLVAALIRNPANEYDANAIEVHVPALGQWGHVGHVPRDLAAHLAPLIDDGVRFQSWIYQVRIDPVHPDRPGIDVGLRRVPDEANTPTPATGGNTMGTPLPTGSGPSGPPSIKLPIIGDAVRFAVIDINPNVPAREFGTGNPKLDKFGRAKMQTVLTVLVLGGGKLGDNQRGYTDVEVGSVGSIFIESYTKYDPDQDRLGGTHLSFGGAVDALEGGLQVGTVGEWKYLQDLPSQAASPRKDRKFRFRQAKPEEAAQTARCEQLRAELAGNVLVAPNGSAPGPFDDEEF